jgi:DNA-directed RNA polymerase subunit beta
MRSLGLNVELMNSKTHAPVPTPGESLPAAE